MVFFVGLATTLPPVAASYQVIVPPLAVAVKVCIGDTSQTT